VSLTSNPQPGCPGFCIYTPQWHGGPVIPPETEFSFRHLLRLAGLRWRYSIPPPRVINKPSGSIKAGNFLISWASGRKAVLHVVEYLLCRGEKFQGKNWFQLGLHFLPKNRVRKNLWNSIWFSCKVHVSFSFYWRERKLLLIQSTAFSSGSEYQNSVIFFY
jgi:hypothetical protein